ncbi:cytochrome oxidase small assembly protein [Roseateles sp. BYS78W]|uniref:Cytochrome oxidase small assembly protein n=1 Tax=Pelomonas candidula TaxID=3299025 RepID=A0ABW7HBZ4_9BURK
MTPEQRKANRRLGLILLTVAIAFGVGFVVKMTMFGH